MKADYHYSEQVLRKLKYSPEDIADIVKTIEAGKFSYMPKKEYDNGNSRWEDSTVKGIDIPTMWLPDNGECRKTVLLLAQDPLRKEAYWEFCTNQSIDKVSNVIIGTPYALHIKASNIKSGLNLNVGIYRELIEQLISEANCRVYCTDIFKYYPSDKQIGDFDINILKAEIESVRPDVYVCMGNFAKKAIKEVGIADEKVVGTPHPRAFPKSWDKWRNANGLPKDNYKNDTIISNIIDCVKKKLQKYQNYKNTDL